MTRSVRTSVAVALCLLTGTSLAYAQATRTWVSGVGDDANPCSRTAPCKTFAGAISKTAAGGEISVLDPGGYGTLTITKSITLSGDGTLASILNSTVSGIVINDTSVLPAAVSTMRVVIRNLSINGAGTTLGVNGIRVVSAGSVIVDRVTIANQSGAGILAEDGDVTVLDTVVSHVAGASLGLGFGARSLNASSIALENSTFSNNNVAVIAEGTSTIRMSNSGFYNNKAAFGCGGGTLASVGNNRKANNTGGPGPVCTPTVAVTLQ